jgi:hypothetical protein
MHQYASKKGRVGDDLGITKIIQQQQQTRTKQVLHDKFVKSNVFASGRAFSGGGPSISGFLTAWTVIV